MTSVESAIESGRCSIAVSGSLMRDEEVVLALNERRALLPMTLAGGAGGPVVDIGDKPLARAISQPNGVLAIVEPGPSDEPAMAKLAERIGQAKYKPTIVVVGKDFNQFKMMMLFRGLKIEHRKERARTFLKSLPIPTGEAAAAPTEVPKAEKARATDESVKFVFVGRDEERATLAGMLATGGPIVVSGPRGIGKRSLVEHAIADAGLERLPDLTLGRGTGFDTLVARLAEICAAGGSSKLADLLKGEHTPQQLVQTAIASLQEATGTEKQVMVIGNLQVAAGRTGDFFRKSRLELLVEALLTNTYPLRLVFTSLVQPVFFREQRDKDLRRLELGGIKGRFYHEIFEAWHAPSFPREKFGPISEKLHGHPIAVRTYAIATRHDPSLVDDERFFRLASVDDTAAIEKQLEKRLQRLDKTLRSIVVYLTHFRYPVDGQVLADLGISRKHRNALVAEGVLEMLGTEQGAKRFRVHPLVERVIPPREAFDFRTLEEVSGVLRKQAASASGVEKLALLQEANRCAILARQPKLAVDVGYPDNDATLESCYGLVRGEPPRLEMADQRLSEILRKDPSNSDAWLLRLELLRRQGADAEVARKALDEALARAGVPELFHEAVAAQLARSNRNAAIKVLETAVETWPDQSRLRCRLASLLQRQGRRPEAIEQLKLAMEADPMLPDAYGLLGMIRREEGATAIDEAETLLREAVRLAPGDVVQTSRLIALLLDVHKGVPERREAVAAELRDLLEQMLQADKDSWEAHLTYGTTLREMGGDPERAEWFLRKARKLAPRRKSLEERFDLEFALLDLSRGRIDEAETRLRKLSRTDPSNHRIFAGLSRVLEARGQLVAAHAELMRAKERTSPHAVDRFVYDQELQRLQRAIEAQAAAMAGDAPAWTPPASTGEEAPVPEVVTEEELEEGRRPGDEDDETRVDAEALLAAEVAAEAPTPAAADEAAAHAPEVSADPSHSDT